MEDPRVYKRRLAREKFLKAMPRGERRRWLREEQHGKWVDIIVPAGTNRAMRRKKTRDGKYTKRRNK